jgi:hypothetical protein
VYVAVPPEGLLVVRAISCPVSMVADEGETVPPPSAVFTVIRTTLEYFTPAGVPELLSVNLIQ